MIKLPPEEAVAFRRAVQSLVENDQVADWQGSGRQIDFVQQLADDGTIYPTHLGNLFSTLDPEWQARLGWSTVNLPLDQAVAFRKAVRSLLESGEPADWRGNGRQIDFVQQLADRGDHVDLSWPPVQRPRLGMACRSGMDRSQPVARSGDCLPTAIRSLVDGGETASWQGNGRQIDFVQQLVDRGTITSTYLSHLFGALDPDWRTALGWTMLSVPLDQAVAFRAAVQWLAESGEAAFWQGNGRQIDFVQQLAVRGVISSTFLGHLFSVLDPEWRAVLGWSSRPATQSGGCLPQGRAVVGGK